MHARKAADQESVNDANIEIDENLSIAAPSEQDIMASFGGFLDMRKRDRNMPRMTEFGGSKW